MKDKIDKKIKAWEKERKNLEIENKQKEVDDDRLNRFVYSKYSEKYFFHMLIIGVVFIIIFIWFILCTEVFEDGTLRFLLSLLFFIIIIIRFKSYFLNKIKKQEGIK